MNQVKALFLFILLACSLNITAQRIKGSDTVLPVSQETAEIFMKDDPDRRVSFFAILFALPFGLSVAVYMSEVADHRTRSFLKPVIELLSGIPSVVYGYPHK